MLLKALTHNDNIKDILIDSASMVTNTHQETQQAALPTNKDDYLALFNESNEAFASTGRICWRLFHHWSECCPDIDEYKFPFECTDIDKETMHAWFELAEMVQDFTSRSHNIYREVFQSSINPRELSKALPCLRCYTKSRIPVTQEMPMVSIVDHDRYVCIICLCV